MEKEFLDLLKKKAAEQSKEPVDPKKIEAKKNVVQEIMDMLSGDMANQMKGLKKVTVASDSSEGLEKGLNKAHELLGAESEVSEDEMEDDSEEMMDDQASEDAKIAELEKQLAELKAKKSMV